MPRSYETFVFDAVSHLCVYLNRDSAPTSQEGRRGQAIGGGSMSVFAKIAGKVATQAGVAEIDTIVPTSPRDQRTVLPGCFRPTKNWDFLVIRDRVPLVALEFKSIMSSYGNNLNNRAEEAVGQGADLNATLQSHGIQPESVFSGYLMIMADDSASRRPTRNITLPLLDIEVEMNDLSYQQRADRMCQRLEEKRIWSCTSFATTVLSDNKGDFNVLSSVNSPVRFFKHLHDFLVENY